jgi:hypothetical protein
MISRIVGLRSENAVWRLICLMGVMLITSLQMKICSDDALMQMIEKVALFNVKNDGQKLDRDKPDRAWW